MTMERVVLGKDEKIGLEMLGHAVRMRELYQQYSEQARTARSNTDRYEGFKKAKMYEDVFYESRDTARAHFTLAHRCGEISQQQLDKRLKMLKVVKLDSCPYSSGQRIAASKPIEEDAVPTRALAPLFATDGDQLVFA